jgi:hypothetical protein
VIELYQIEEQIMKCWKVTEDIDDLFEYIVEGEYGKMDQDEISNVLMGMKVLYDIKFSKLFEMHEEVVKQYHAQNPI